MKQVQYAETSSSVGGGAGYSQKQRNRVSTHMAYTLKKPWAMR